MALGCNFIIGLAKYYKYVTKGTDFIIGQHSANIWLPFCIVPSS